MPVSSPHISASLRGWLGFSVADPKLCNALPLVMRQSTTLSTFKTQLKTHLFSLAFFSAHLHCLVYFPCFYFTLYALCIVSFPSEYLCVFFPFYLASMSILCQSPCCTLALWLSLSEFIRSIVSVSDCLTICTFYWLCILFVQCPWVSWKALF